jgi:hypothetical protein
MAGTGREGANNGGSGLWLLVLIIGAYPIGVVL